MDQLADCWLVVGRSGAASSEYYYGRDGSEMKSDRGGRSYDGDTEQRRDNRRRSVCMC